MTVNDSKLETFIASLTEDTTPATNDLLMTYDTSATALKRATLANLLAAVGGGIGADGWATADAMTYASADAPTFTVTVGGDQTTKYYPGMRVRLTQTTVKYFIITAVAYSSSTTITLYGGTDYTLANAAITNPCFSSAKAPAGFPLNPAKWTVEVEDTTTREQVSPVNGTWYNIGAVSISIPIGVWNVEYAAVLESYKSTAVSAEMKITLSSANNSESDTQLTARYKTTNSTDMLFTMSRRKVLALSAKASYYLNMVSVSTGPTNIFINGALTPTLIRAVCAYL